MHALFHPPKVLVGSMPVTLGGLLAEFCKRSPALIIRVSARVQVPVAFGNDWRNHTTMLEEEDKRAHVRAQSVKVNM